MATDFSYNEKTINSGGPIKPSGINQPLDPRTEVKLYADIETIPNPYVGMVITVLQDETNSNKMTDYKVISLKADDLGVANSVVDRVQRYVDYLGASGGSSGDGLTSEQAQQLTTAYEHSQSPHINTTDVNNAVSTYVTAHKAELKGDKGDKGDVGEKGDTGAKGEKGDTGATGANGVTPTLKVGTVTTLEAGNNATVTMSTDNNEYTLNFGIPKGAKGDVGASGGSSGDGLTSEQEAKLNSIDNKVDKIDGKGLSTEDFTTEEKTTLANLKTTIGDSTSGLVKDVEDLKLSSGSGSGSSTETSTVTFDNLDTTLQEALLTVSKGAIIDDSNLPVEFVYPPTYTSEKTDENHISYTITKETNDCMYPAWGKLLAFKKGTNPVKKFKINNLVQSYTNSSGWTGRVGVGAVDITTGERILTWWRPGDSGNDSISTYYFASDSTPNFTKISIPKVAFSAHNAEDDITFELSEGIITISSGEKIATIDYTNIVKPGTADEKIDFSNSAIGVETANTTLAFEYFFVNEGYVPTKLENCGFNIPSYVLTNKEKIDTIQKQLGISNVSNANDYFKDQAKCVLSTTFKSDTGLITDNAAVDTTNKKVTLVPSSYVGFSQSIHMDNFYYQARVKVTNTSSIFGFCSNDIESANDNKRGCIFMVDLSQSKLFSYERYTGGYTLPNSLSSTNITLTVESGKEYMIELRKNGDSFEFKFTDCVGNISDSLNYKMPTYDNTSGIGAGCPCVICTSGEVEVRKFNISVPVHNIKAVFIGDSITEGFTNSHFDNIRWSSLVKSELFNNNAIICAKTGDKTNHALQKVNMIYNLGIKPDIVIVSIGTNDFKNTSNFTNNITKIVEKIETEGSIPVICVPPLSDSLPFDDNIHSGHAAVRDFILTNNYNTIRFDYAMSTNRDGANIDRSLSIDGVHPNTNGHKRMAEQAKLELGLLI